MIAQLNPGCVLPVYLNRVNQSHLYFGRHWSAAAIKCRATLGIPFQFPVPNVPSTAPTIVAVNAADETVTQSLGNATVESLVGGRAIILYSGLSGGQLAPGHWFYKIVAGASTWWSEVFQTIDHTCVDQWTEIEFRHEKDKGGILYQTGWKQSFGMVNAAWDSLPIVRDIEAVENANGVRFITFANTKTRVAFEAAPFPDYSISALVMLAEHSEVRLKFLPGSRVDTLSRVEFESRLAGPFHHIGRFTAETASDVFTGCEENMELL